MSGDDCIKLIPLLELSVRRGPRTGTSHRQAGQPGSDPVVAQFACICHCVIAPSNASSYTYGQVLTVPSPTCCCLSQTVTHDNTLVISGQHTYTTGGATTGFTKQQASAQPPQTPTDQHTHQACRYTQQLLQTRDNWLRCVVMRTKQVWRQHTHIWMGASMFNTSACEIQIQPGPPMNNHYEWLLLVTTAATCK